MKPKRKSWGDWLFYSVILLVVIVVLLLWQWSTLTSWASGVAELFGWGLLLVIIAFGTLIGVVWRRRLSLFIYHWNRWLGGIAFIMAAWGILALFPGYNIRTPYQFTCLLVNSDNYHYYL